MTAIDPQRSSSPRQGGPNDPVRLRILAIEPYYGGSHRAFIDGLVAASRHDWTLITLPARKWKWRMRGAAIWAAEELWRGGSVSDLDLIFTCDMLSVADLRALLPPALIRIPIVCYFHENQITYPLSQHDRADYQYAFTNITSCLAADEVWFNSDFHRRSFLAGAAALLRGMPDCIPRDALADIEGRARVMHPGVDLRGMVPRSARDPIAPPVVLWNHRWEYDKNPDAFFGALFSLADAGVDFRLIVLGETFRTAPPIFDTARSRLAERILQFGTADSRPGYWSWLVRADIAVSTAVHEFFGLATIEAMAAGCRPLVPSRLAYPELIPLALHADCLYADDAALPDTLRRALSDVLSARWGDPLAGHARDFDWSVRADTFDNELTRVASGFYPIEGSPPCRQS